MTSEPCGKMIRCWDHLPRPCLRPKGHIENGNPHRHNPFSNSIPASSEVGTEKKKENLKIAVA